MCADLCVNWYLDASMYLCWMGPKCCPISTEQKYFDLSDSKVSEDEGRICYWCVQSESMLCPTLTKKISWVEIEVDVFCAKVESRDLARLHGKLITDCSGKRQSLSESLTHYVAGAKLQDRLVRRLGIFALHLWREESSSSTRFRKVAL